MFRDLLRSFTATHVTIMFGIAVLAPSALYAIPSYNNVAIENVTTGVRAAVDSTGHLLTNDSVGNYANTTNNYVRIAARCDSSVNSGTVIYTPPSGKALIVKAANLTHFSGTPGSDNWNYIQIGGTVVFGFDDANADGAHSIDFGNGFYVQSGEPLTSYCNLGTWYATMTGYLVPSTLVPAAGTAEAAAQSVHIGAQLMKGGKHL